MNRRRRRVRIKSGAWVPAEPHIAGDDEVRRIDAALVLAGFVRQDRMRVHVSSAGVITTRLVWRRRREGLTVNFTMVMRSPLDQAAPPSRGAIAA